VDPERFIIVSRGGTALWYQGLSGRYLDIFEFIDPRRFATSSEKRWYSEQRQKQFVPRGDDENLIAWARKQAGAREGQVLHPSLMYRLFAPVFQGLRPLETMLKRVRYEALSKPPLPATLMALPKKYVAVRFYFRPSFPDTTQNRAFVKKLVGRIAKHTPVVLLNTGLKIDDHPDCPVDGVVSLEGHVCAVNNLDTQSRVIANALGFVGTYGGLSYLAPFLGVPSVAFHSDNRSLKPVHLEAVRAACAVIGGHFVELHLDDVGLLEQIGLIGS
jgi:hypothetical protein